MTGAQLDIYDQPSNGGKDYIVQIKIKNGPLLRAIRMRGFKSVAELSRQSGIHLQTIYGYLALRRAPITKKRGKWQKSVTDLARFLKIPPIALFPEQHLEHALAKNSGELEVSAAEVVALIEHAEPAEALEQREEIYSTLTDLMTTLSPREERVLRRRFGFDGHGGETADAIAKDFDVTRQTIFMIEARALRKLRHPARSAKLADAGCVMAQKYVAKARAEADRQRKLEAEADRARTEHRQAAAERRAAAAAEFERMEQEHAARRAEARQRDITEADAEQARAKFITEAEHQIWQKQQLAIANRVLERLRRRHQSRGKP